MAQIKNLYSNFPSSPSPAPKKDSPIANDDQDDGQSSIESDPKAMQAVGYLVQQGYSADDVAQAMDDLSGGNQDTSTDDGSMDDGGSQSGGQSAPLQIPGMR